MNKNLHIAKNLIRLAKELVAVPTATFDEYEKFDSEYQKKFGIKSDSSIWDLFKTEKERDDYLKIKSIAHPNLSEIISIDTINKILSQGYFVICSAGLNDDEAQSIRKKIIAEFGKMNINKFNERKNQIVKTRYEELRRFLDSLDCRYYEVIGQFYNEILEAETSELSYIVDLTDIGKNNDTMAKSLMRKITEFCKTNMKQCATIEGINTSHAYVYCGDRSYRMSRGESQDYGYGRSTVRTDTTNGMRSWVDDYDWDLDSSPSDWIK